MKLDNVGWTSEEGVVGLVPQDHSFFVGVKMSWHAHGLATEELAKANLGSCFHGDFKGRFAGGDIRSSLIWSRPLFVLIIVDIMNGWVGCVWQGCVAMSICNTLVLHMGKHGGYGNFLGMKEVFPAIVHAFLHYANQMIE